MKAILLGEVKNLHFQWFAAGTAAAFGSLYLYLYFKHGLSRRVCIALNL